MHACAGRSTNRGRGREGDYHGILTPRFAAAIPSTGGQTHPASACFAQQGELPSRLRRRSSEECRARNGSGLPALAKQSIAAPRISAKPVLHGASVVDVTSAMTRGFIFVRGGILRGVGYRVTSALRRRDGFRRGPADAAMVTTATAMVRIDRM